VTLLSCFQRSSSTLCFLIEFQKIEARPSRCVSWFPPKPLLNFVEFRGSARGCRALAKFPLPSSLYPLHRREVTFYFLPHFFFFVLTSPSRELSPSPTSTAAWLTVWFFFFFGSILNFLMDPLPSFIDQLAGSPPPHGPFVFCSGVTNPVREKTRTSLSLPAFPAYWQAALYLFFLSPFFAPKGTSR